MCDVNPLGPLMHLRQIEKDALALRTARIESRFGILDSAWKRVVKLLNGLDISFRTGYAGDAANARKHYPSGN